MAVHVHVGQCGNQIGQHFWGMAEDLHSGYKDAPYKSPVCSLFDARGKARSVFVDSEPKVVNCILRGNRTGVSLRSVNQANVVFEQNGRGNNWAMGYFGKRNASAGDLSLCDRSLDVIRKEVENADTFNGFLMTYSLGGGTGSGLGSRLLQELRDRYPKTYIVSSVVSASAAGDTPLQHYNTMFALQWVQEFADGIIFKENDVVLRSVLRSEGVRVRSEKPKQGSGFGAGQRATAMASLSASLSAMNQSIAQDVAGLFFPTSPPRGVPPSSSDGTNSSSSGRNSSRSSSRSNCNSKTSSGLPPANAKRGGGPEATGRAPTGAPPGHILGAPGAVRGFDPGQWVSAVCPSPGLKFVDVRTATVKPGSTGSFLAGGCSWVQQANELCSPDSLRDSQQRPLSTIASQTLYRGVGRRGDGITPDALSKSEQVFSRALRHVAWNRDAVGHSSLLSSLPASVGSPQSVTLSANRAHVMESFQRVKSRAEVMFSAKAYTHWYTSCGIRHDDFLEAFEAVNYIVDQYGFHTASSEAVY